MKKAIAVILASILVLSLGACSTPTPLSSSSATASQSEASSESKVSEAATGKVKIGLVVPTLTNDFYVHLKDGALKYAAEKGIDLSVLDSGDDAAKQASNVEDLITQQVKLVLLIPTDSDAVVNSVEALNTANIPVITLDRASSGGKVVSHIASDNEAGGKLAGQYIADQLHGTGSVVELEGKVGTSAARDRGKGFNEIISVQKGIKVVAKQTANFDKAQGLSVMENILQAQPNIQAVFAHNDEMALGALEACRSAGKTNIKIVGFDASPDAVTAVRNGTMAATIAQQPELMAQSGIYIALKVIKGETVEKSISIPLKLVTK